MFLKKCLAVASFGFVSVRWQHLGDGGLRKSLGRLPSLLILPSMEPVFLKSWKNFSRDKPVTVYFFFKIMKAFQVSVFSLNSAFATSYSFSWVGFSFCFLNQPLIGVFLSSLNSDLRFCSSNCTTGFYFKALLFASPVFFYCP